MLVTKTKFLSYQNTFYNKIMRTPYFIELEIIEVVKDENEDEEEFSLERFVGDSERRTSKRLKLRCLYQKDISDRTREKYGLPKEVNGIVYLSPRQLVPKLGNYHLDWNKTKVHFEGRTQVINKIIYLEELYNSCVGVQIFVKDDEKGG